MLSVVLGTRSEHKLTELRRMIAAAALPIRLAPLPAAVAEVAETGVTFRENAAIKALSYAQATGQLVLADDSGLEVDALGGEPGVHSAYFAGRPRDDLANNRKLCEKIRQIPPNQRTARYLCCLILARPGTILLEAEGSVEGTITPDERGAGGFGYDPHFVVAGMNRTAAELTPAEKDVVSHRGRALRAMLARIADRLRSDPSWPGDASAA
ncbi:MAG: RdgB/HAM1 family non-canonical purine NTP pyrophosphatase [Planctomycetia bacterium]|nr:MAG: RdgB/HAM1 family non-canonical purine NTP pyrophosphatase [Planctomycetia bacterium]